MTPRSEQPKEHCEHECVCPDHDGRTGKPCEGILYEPIDEGMNFGSKYPHDTRSRPHPAPRPPCEECIYQARAAKAQQGIDAAIKELQKWKESLDYPDCPPGDTYSKVIALLQAGDP